MKNILDNKVADNGDVKVKFPLIDLSMDVKWIASWVVNNMLEDKKITYHILLEGVMRPINQFTIRELLLEFIGAAANKNFKFDIKVIDGIIHIIELPAEKVSDIMSDNYNVVKSLLENGEAVDGRNHMGSTPFHYACISGNFKVAQLLKEYNADVNAIDDAGMNSFHYLAHSNNITDNRQDIINTFTLLKISGCDLNLIDNAGRTPTDIAVKCNNEAFLYSISKDKYIN